MGSARPQESIGAAVRARPSKTVVTELDELSNSVIGLVHAGDLGAAEAACRQLQQRYPDQVDGIWRLATVQEARGDRLAAARCYREAVEFMRSHEGFEEQSIVHMIESAERMEAEQALHRTAVPRRRLAIRESRRGRHR